MNQLPTPEDEPAAVTGARLFTEVSARYPSSVAVQAAALALRCNEMRDSALRLSSGLLADPEQIGRIGELATNAHRHLGLPPVGEARVRGIVESVFRLGQAMQDDWTTPEIETTVDLYPIVKGDPVAVHVHNAKVRSQLGLG